MRRKIENTTLKELAEISMRDGCQGCPFEKFECLGICESAASIMRGIEKSEEENE